MKVTMQAPCKYCDELVPISGDAELTDYGMRFVSDEAGTRAGWEHQAKHGHPEDYPPPLDPDCLAGSHKACHGTAWDVEADDLVDCQCGCHEVTNVVESL